MPDLPRCPWPRTALDVEYHDREWGVPVHDDRRWFELITLEGAQAGLSWSTILAKREGYRAVFDGLDPAVLAGWGEAEVARAVADARIVRHRAKVASVPGNARAFLAVQAACGSFDGHVWRFVGGRPRVNRWAAAGEVPARSAEADALSRDLRARGFRFVGPSICYALMQAGGLVNDHLVGCFRRAAVSPDAATLCRQPFVNE